MQTQYSGGIRRAGRAFVQLCFLSCLLAGPAAALAAAHEPAQLASARETDPRAGRAANAGPFVAAVPDVDAPVDLLEDDPSDQGLFPRGAGDGALPVGPPIGGSIWVSQGPGPARFGQVENVFPDNEVSGAVHVVAAHPTDADILYLGGVNGGVWKTNNATAVSPTWVPLTDSQLGLSIGALEFDPTDGTHQTLVAGVGRFSSYGRTGPFRTGLLRTTDGGSTWTAITGGGTLLDKNISGVAARGGTLVVSVDVAVIGIPAGTGIFRSTDGGVMFTQISTGDGTATGLPGGQSFDLEGDPTSPTTLYTSINFAESSGGVNGIYKSTDTGATWSKVSNALMDSFIVSGQTSNIEISVGNSGQVYVAILQFGQLRHGGVFRSGNGGATWQAMDIPVTNEGGVDVDTNPTFHPDYGVPGSQGVIHFSIQADPSDPNIVYVGGDRQPAPLPNSIGAQDFSGRLFRGDASQPSGSQWVHLTHSDVLGAPGGGTASSSAPHADSREIVFDANGDLIEGDDGGIYRRTFPQSNLGDWFSIVGNLAVTEFHDIAYDRNAQVIIGGSQDNGTLLQLSPGNTTWDNIRGGDGGDVAVDVTSQPGFSIRYFSSQNLGGFSRFTYDATNSLVATAFPARTLIGGGNPFGGQFTTPLALSRFNSTQLAIGGNASVYESLDQGETIREIGPGIVVNSTTSGNAMAFGGRLPGSTNPDVLYVGSGATLFRRTLPGSLLQATNPLPGGATTIRDVVIDPENWNRVYVILDAQVVLSEDAGTNWIDITGDLTGVETLRSGVFITSAGEEGLIVGTNIGAYLSLRTALGSWNEIGTNLPNAPVWDLDYDEVDDVLVAGTLGRGAWVIPNASGTILPDCSQTDCLGACCFAASCTDSMTETDCLTAGGSWSVGDTCDIACLGSCCDGFSCLDGHTTGTCGSLGGAFKLGGHCVTSSCSGACCETLVCTDNVPEAGCAGVWQESRNCADECLGACCTGATCTDSLTESACVAGLGGLFLAGGNCGSIRCACFNGAGDCAAAHGGVGCASETCCNIVCDLSAACCTAAWDSTCADLARGLCAENDACDDAFSIPEGLTPFNNSLATTDGPPDCLNSDTNVGTKDLWYVYDAACTGTMIVDLCANTFYDNTLQIYETDSCAPLGAQLDCGDDTCGQGGGPATLTVPVSRGVQYLIRVGGWGGSSGSGEIDLSVLPDDIGDSDGDGIINSCDSCLGDDALIGLPCDSPVDADNCPTGVFDCSTGTLLCTDDDALDDADGDGVPDCQDLCPGGDDTIDCQPNGIPDACDISGGSSTDANANGVPDECDVNPPAAAAPPHDRAKNRYLSFDPNNTNAVSFRVTRIAPGAATEVGWVRAPDANGIAGVAALPFTQAWTAPVIHAGDCQIIPVASYEIHATADGVVFSPPLTVSTIAQPAPKFWGDTVGSFDGVQWSEPNNIVNANDFLAALQKFQNLASAPHVTVVDVQSVSSIDPCLNRITNIADVFILIQAFQGSMYPFTTDPAACPPCP